jgi:predicted transglutaminase-like cysteine proteinase
MLLNPLLLPGKARMLLRVVGIAALMALTAPGATSAGQPPDFLKARQAIAAPSGSAGLCSSYGWACARLGHLNMSDAQAMRIAQSVNGAVNRQTRPISDRAQYGVEERWALPTTRGGDCEDVVLLKKKALIARGVSPDRLLIATVLDRNRGSHAVLVMRTASGDYVLDSLVGAIKLWRATGYSFLKMQNPASPSRWNAIFSGGIFSARA